MDTKLIEETDWEIEKYYAFSNPSWKCGINDKDIPLVAIVKVWDLREFVSENDIEDIDHPIILELLTVPKMEYISEKYLDSCLSSLGIPNPETYKLLYADIVSYGGGISLSIKGINNDKSLNEDVDGKFVLHRIETYLSEDLDIDKFIEAFVKPRLIPIFTLIGFYLDKAWNRIGTTGWDSIHGYITDKYAIDITMERRKK